ncbi:3276_t:CDS:2 [Diversispora eburnea]|uniref:3276_t:CDS:1 n=1 Tax=Diversispora eburnea TaxID=1213867 RepID=A0A9N8W218_9GLOM|nr:3276_t:CDS:2 [Diversispora eburnea]
MKIVNDNDGLSRSAILYEKLEDNELPTDFIDPNMMVKGNKADNNNRIHHNPFAEEEDTYLNVIFFVGGDKLSPDENDDDESGKMLVLIKGIEVNN